ncbi:MAG: hypothetical protein D6765_13110, partial [Bacteroidetes bacterium]
MRVILGWIFFSCTGLGLPSAAAQQAYVFHRLTTAEGLTSQNYNYYVHQSAEGFVWISSINGLNRFDGLEVRTYTHSPDAPRSLFDNNVHSAFREDPRGGFWFSTAGAVHRYEPATDDFSHWRLELDGAPLPGEYQLLFLDTLRRRLFVRVDAQLLSASLDTPSAARALGTFRTSNLWTIQPQKDAGHLRLLVPDNPAALLVVDLVQGQVRG